MKRAGAFWICILMLFTSVKVRSQPSILVNIPPPYTADLSVWRSDPSRILVTLRGGTSPSTVRISGFVVNQDGSVRLETKDDQPTMRIDLRANEVRMLNGRELSLVDPGSVRYMGTNSATIARTGKLPEGSYRFCLKLLDYNNPRTILSPENCASFTITYLDPPQLINPACAPEFIAASPQNINFSWVMPNAPAGAINYRFTLIELTASQNPSEAFHSGALRSVIDRTVSITSLMYGPSDPPLHPGSRYGWRVQAVDPSGRALIRSDGYSEACALRFASTDLSMEARYPDAGDTIPYLPPHLVVRFTPYNDNITQMDYTLTCTGGGQSFTSHRVLNWPDGPRRGQRWPDERSNERSTFIVVNQDRSGDDAVVSPWSNSLRRGVEYTWTVTATFTAGGSRRTLTTPSRTFFIGVTPPGLITPHDHAEIARSEQPITLSWQSTRPHHLNPPDLLGMGSHSTSMFIGATDEHFIVELSRQRTFATTIATFSGATARYNTGEECAELYQRRDHILSTLDTGTYYWRAKWLRRPEETAYTESPVWQFHIGDSVRTTATTPPDETSAACRDICSIALPTNHTPSSATFAVGNNIHVGRFQMELTRVSGSGSSLSGEGTIHVPYLRAAVMVEFSGISVNTDNVMYDGEITGKQASGSPLINSVANGLSTAIGLSQSDITTIQTFASQSAQLVSAFTGIASVGLPLGFDNIVGGHHIVVGIIGLVFHPTDAKLNAVMSYEIPDMGPGMGIGLGARNICFHPGGVGGDGRATLYLPSDIGFRDEDDHHWGYVFKGPTMDGSSMSDSGTYVTWNCHGFEKLRIAADVIFPRTWLVPINASGNVVGGHEKVRATFTSMIEASYVNAHHTNWGWMATGTMASRFAVPDAPDFIFDATMIAIDQSDNENPPGMQFPDGYIEEERGPTWRGFYINTLMMSLPNRFRTFEEGRPIQFAMNNLVIDHSGFSASFRTNNLVSVNYGGWRGTIDTIGINFVSNSLTEGFISGGILTPLSTTNWLRYRAAITNHLGSVQFVFNVRMTEALHTNLWAADLTLDPTSRIELRAGGGEGFVAMLVMSGQLSISGNLTPPTGAMAGGMPGMDFSGIHFQNLALGTMSPYLGCLGADGVIHGSASDCISFAHASDDHSAGGFPVSISEISLNTDLSNIDRPRFGLGFNVSVHFQSGSDGIGGGTTITVWGVLANLTHQPSFAFDGVSLNAINLDVEVGSTVRIAGRVDFYGNNDPVFGNGFRGHVRGTFLQKVTGEATVQFGSKMRSPTDTDPFRYWYVDAMVYLPTGIPFMTGLAFYGFGGGAWYNMNYDRSHEPAAPPTAPTETNSAPQVPPGYTASGYRFIPSEPRPGGNAFGFRAKVAVGTYGSDQVFNADITMSIQFADGGIASIRLDGNGFLLAGVQNRQDAIATVDVTTEYQFVEQTLHMTMSVALLPPYNQFITLLGARDAILFHADPHTWYFRAGTPTHPSGLSVARLLDVHTYLMAGNEVLPPGPLPEHIRSRLGNLPVVRTSEMRNGDGFAFGGMIDLRSPRLEIFPGWAQFRATLGFDFALLHQVPAATCIGSSTPIGANGWYGTGRAYTYLYGAVGIVNYFVDTNSRWRYPELASVEVIAALAAGTPNPSWVAGYISGEYSILGRRAGEFHGQFRYGEECHPTPRPRENPVVGLELIGQLTPADGSHDVSAAVRPEATFDYAIAERFELPEVSDDGSTTRVHVYRLQIRNFTVQLHGSGGLTSVTGSYSVLSDRRHVSFIPRNGLNWQSTYTAKISAYMQEWDGRNWNAVNRRNGHPVEDTVTTTFMTGIAPDPFLEENVAFTYPLNRQRYFLQAECRTGVVQFIAADQGSLRMETARTGNRVAFIARFLRTSGGGSLEAPVTFNASARRLEFTIPQLAHSTVYALQIIRRETRSSGVPEDISTSGRRVAAASAPNLPGSTLNSSTSNRSSGGFSTLIISSGGRGSTGGANFTIDPGTLSGSRIMRGSDSVGRGEELLYYYYFRTSQFDRLAEKINAFTALPPEHPAPFGLFEIMRVRYQTPELLDYYDMNGYSGSAESPVTILPLVRPNANSRTSSWHRTYTNTWIYDAYSRLRRMGLYSGTTDFERAFNNYNFDPMNHVSSVLATYNSLPQSVLLDADLYSAPGNNTSSQTITINYNHGTVIPPDYTRLRSTISRVISTYGSEHFSPQDWTWIQSIAAKRYEPYHHAAYSLGFTYGYNGCADPDAQKEIISKGFQY